MNEQETQSEEDTVSAVTGVLGSPLTPAQTVAISEERQAAMLAAMQEMAANKSTPEEYEARRQRARMNREFDWDVLSLEFEAIQQSHGTRQAIQNLVFEIAVGMCVSFAPGCYGLVMNDGSPEMTNAIHAIVEQRVKANTTEVDGIKTNPTPRPRSPTASCHPSAQEPATSSSDPDQSTSETCPSGSDISPAL